MTAVIAECFAVRLKAYGNWSSQVVGGIELNCMNIDVLNVAGFRGGGVLFQNVGPASSRGDADVDRRIGKGCNGISNSGGRSGASTGNADEVESLVGRVEDGDRIACSGGSNSNCGRCGS